MKDSNSRRTALLLAFLVAGFASFVPVIQLAFLPLIYLDTHIHELCHALAASFAGGQVMDIVVHSDGSGVTPILGGNPWVFTPAGYMGATVVGAAIIWFGRNPVSARYTLAVLGCMLAASCVVWVREDLFGMVSGVFWVAALGLMAKFLKGNAALFACQLIGVEQCFNSISSVNTLLHVTYLGERESDAALMASFSHLPAVFWATLWCGFSLCAVGITAVAVWKYDSPKTPQP